MAINVEDATAIVRTIRENLQRLGVPSLHEEVLQRIGSDEHTIPTGREMLEPEHFLENYINTLMWVLSSSNPALARGALQRLQRSVDGGIEGVVVDLGPSPLTGASISAPFETLVPDYSSLADGLREVLASLQLRYHEPPAAEADTPDEDSDKEHPSR
jgi:hypothetical protein